MRRHPSARNSRRSTLPVAVIGSVSANCTKRGYSWAASCTLTNSWISRASSSLAAKPGRSTIHALIDSVRIGNADHRRHRHRRMLHQRMLDFGGADAIAGGGNDVVLAADVPEITVLILHAEIPGQQEF